MTTKEEECMKLNMQGADDGKKLHNLKRRRTRERGNITCFVTEVGNFTDTMTLEDYEYYKDRLHETLGRLTSLDDGSTTSLTTGNMMRTYRNAKSK